MRIFLPPKTRYSYLFSKGRGGNKENSRQEVGNADFVVPVCILATKVGPIDPPRENEYRVCDGYAGKGTETA